MEQHSILLFIPSAIDSPSNVVVVVTGLSGDQLTADGPGTSLGPPKVTYEGLVPQVIYGFVEEPFFKVEFPVGVIRIGILSNLDMSPNGNGCCFEEFDGDLVSFLIDYTSLEDVAVMVFAIEVLLEYPIDGLIAMSTFSPSQKGHMDMVVDSSEDLLADHMAMIVCPSSDDWVQAANESIR